MMDILQKFIFGEVFQTGKLTMKQREMITCITLATMQTLPQLKAHAGAALNVGVTPEELREVMYLTAPFIGFPKMLNAVTTVNEVFKERGISLPLDCQSTVTEETRHETGKTIQDKLYPGGIASVMEGLPDDLGKNVEQFLTDYFFGDIYSRGSLDFADTRIVRLLRADNFGSRKPTPFALSWQHQCRQHARNINCCCHSVFTLHWFSCRYQGVAYHQAGIYQTGFC